MILGRVDEIDGNYVATRFLAGLVPTGCVYVTSKSTMAIRTSWRSVGIGYGRVWAPVFAAVTLVAGFAAGGVRAAVLPVLILLGVTALAHRGGRLSDEAKERLRLLGTVTGLRIDPVLLQPATREAKRLSLHGLMEKGGIPATPSSILAVLEDIPVPALPLVYGYARYSGDDPLWRETAEALYRRHEASALV
jgi:hypothetical protein